MAELSESDKRIFREAREHAVKHKAPEGACASCDLWRAYTKTGGQKATLKAIDFVSERHGLEPYTEAQLAADLVRAIRAQLGESDWTSRGLE